MELAIVGLGTAVPPHSVSQTEAAGLARIVCARDEDDAALLGTLHRHSGVERRHMVFAGDVLDDVRCGTARSGSPFVPGVCGASGPGTAARMAFYRTNAPELALRAARQALENSRQAPTVVTHLITVSCTGFSAPGVDLALISGLGLPPTVTRTHIGFMGCHGAVNGLRVAQAFAATKPGACVLLCCVELCSIHYHYGWDPRRLVANALFADGAAALVGVAGHSEGCWRLRATGSCVFPGSARAMTWDVGDHGFEMTLSARVPGLIADNLRPWLEAWLSAQGLTSADVGSWAVHGGGPRVLGAVSDCLGLPIGALDASRQVLAECGNMSSPTVLFVLDRLRRAAAPRPCVALAFGPGLAAEAALFG